MIRQRIGVLLLLGGVLSACGDGPREPAAPAVPAPWADEERAVALVVAEDAPHDFALRTLLESTFGGVDVLDVAAAESWSASLSDRSVVVLGHDTVRRVEPGDLPVLETFARNGGALVLETPDTSWARLAGVRLAASERLDRAPWPLSRDASVLFGDGVRGGLSASRGTPTSRSADRPPDRFTVPLSVWRYAPARARDGAAAPRSRAAGRPAVWSRPLDDGTVVSLAHHLGRFELDLSRDDSTWLSHPLRDAWVSRCFESEAAPTPWPRWSPAPYGFDGVLSVATGDAVPDTRPGFPHGTATPTVSYGPAGRPVGAVRPWTMTLTDDLRLMDWLGRNASLGAGLLRIVAPPASADDLAALADATGHAFMPAEALGDWWAARNGLRLAWSSIGVFVVAVDTRSATEATQLPLGLLLPATWRDETLVGWTATWSPAPSRRIVRGGRTWVEIAVPPGTRGSLRANYQPRPGP